MPDFPVKDPKTGKVYQFKWDSPTPPTDEDIDEMILSIEEGERKTTSFTGRAGHGLSEAFPDPAGKIFPTPPKVDPQHPIASFLKTTVSALDPTDMLISGPINTAIDQIAGIPQDYRDITALPWQLQPAMSAYKGLSKGAQYVGIDLPTMVSDAAKGRYGGAAGGLVAPAVLGGLFHYLGGGGKPKVTEAAKAVEAPVPVETWAEIPTAPIAGEPPFNTNQFGLRRTQELSDFAKAFPFMPERFQPPSTNATVMNALLPESLKKTPVTRHVPQGPMAGPIPTASGTPLPAVPRNRGGLPAVEAFPTGGRGVGGNVSPGASFYEFADQVVTPETAAAAIEEQMGSDFPPELRQGGGGTTAGAFNLQFLYDKFKETTIGGKFNEFVEQAAAKLQEAGTRGAKTVGESFLPEEGSGILSPDKRVGPAKISGVGGFLTPGGKRDYSINAGDYIDAEIRPLAKPVLPRPLVAGDYIDAEIAPPTPRSTWPEAPSKQVALPPAGNYPEVPGLPPGPVDMYAGLRPELPPGMQDFMKELLQAFKPEGGIGGGVDLPISLLNKARAMGINLSEIKNRQQLEAEISKRLMPASKVDTLAERETREGWEPGTIPNTPTQRAMESALLEAEKRVPITDVPPPPPVSRAAQLAEGFDALNRVEIPRPNRMGEPTGNLNPIPQAKRPLTSADITARAKVIDDMVDAGVITPEEAVQLRAEAEAEQPSRNLSEEAREKALAIAKKASDRELNQRATQRELTRRVDPFAPLRKSAKERANRGEAETEVDRAVKVYDDLIDAGKRPEAIEQRNRVFEAIENESEAVKTATAPVVKPRATMYESDVFKEKRRKAEEWDTAGESRAKVNEAIKVYDDMLDKGETRGAGAQQDRIIDLVNHEIRKIERDARDAAVAERVKKAASRKLEEIDVTDPDSMLHAKAEGLSRRLKSLDSIKAPDDMYKEALPDSSKPLKAGETWRDRVVAQLKKHEGAAIERVPNTGIGYYNPTTGEPVFKRHPAIERDMFGTVHAVEFPGVRIAFDDKFRVRKNTIYWDSVPSMEAYFAVNDRFPGMKNESGWSGNKLELGKGRGGEPELKVLYSGIKPSLPPEIRKFINEAIGLFKPSETMGKEVKGMIDTGRKPTQANLREPVDKVIQAMRDAQRFRVIQDNLITQERAARQKAAEGVKTPGLKGFYEMLSKMKGDMEKVKVEALGQHLTEFDKDALIDLIKADKELDFYQRLRGQYGLNKLFEGRLPVESELGPMRKVFGEEFVTEIKNLYAGIPIEKLPTTKQVGRAALGTSNFMKAMESFGDFSGMLKQGAGLIHKRAFWEGIKPMLKSTLSPDFFHKSQADMRADPYYKLAKKHKLALTDLESLSTREEAFHSKLAEKVPGVKLSNRAYVSFLNKLRFDTFKALLKDAAESGVDLEANPGLIKEYADFVNNASGRGSLGVLEQHAVPLNGVLFSPRLIASRVNTLNALVNPLTFTKMNKTVRMQYWKSAAAIATTSVVMTNFMKLFGSEDTEHNPLSSDFEKAKFGKVRLDPNAGYAQFITAFARLAMNEKIDKYGYAKNLAEGFKADTRWDIFEKFGISKASPLASFIHTWATEKDFAGNKVKGADDLSAEVINRFVPLVIQDIYDIAKNDPQYLPLVPLAVMGMGLQDYRETSGGGMGKDILKAGKDIFGSIPMPKGNFMDSFAPGMSNFQDRLRANEKPTVPPPAPKNDIQGKVDNAATRFNLDPNLFNGLVKKESNYNPNARSGAGAVGLTQLMPLIANAYGVKDRTDADQNLEGGAKFLSHLMDKYKDERIALAAYNAGETRVDKWLKTNPNMETLEGLPMETKDYVKTIMKNMMKKR